MIIGLSGMAGCGKDTVADILVAEHGFKRIAFADKLRTMTLKFDPWVATAPTYEPGRDVATGTRMVRLSELVDDCGWDEAKRAYPEVRRCLQVMGTEVVRGEVGENFWVDYVMQAMANDPGNWVITDCRFENEARAVADFMNNGWVVKIGRPGLEPLPGAHASEAGIPDFLVDYELRNDSDLMRLKPRVEDMLHWIEENS